MTYIVIAWALDDHQTYVEEFTDKEAAQDKVREYMRSTSYKEVRLYAANKIPVTAKQVAIEVVFGTPGGPDESEQG